VSTNHFPNGLEGVEASEQVSRINNENNSASINNPATSTGHPGLQQQLDAAVQSRRELEIQIRDQSMEIKGLKYELASSTASHEIEAQRTQKANNAWAVNALHTCYISVLGCSATFWGPDACRVSTGGTWSQGSL
jgi:hypothetical protein